MPKPLFDQALRVAVMAMAAIAPWFFGGVEARTQAVLMLCGALVVAGWLFLGSRKEDPLPLAAAPLIAALLLALVQLTPLAADLVAMISPGGGKLWRELTDVEAEAASVTATVSLYPASTRVDLCRLSLAAAVFVMGACLFAGERTLLMACALVSFNGAAISVFGIVQRLTWNGQLFWSLPLKRGVPFGPFINKNNACGYLLLCLAAALGLLVWTFNRPGVGKSRGAVASGRRFSFARLTASQLAALSLTGCIVAGVLSSLSRGGFLALAAATAITLGILLQTRGRGRTAWTLGAAMVIALAIVFWTGTSADVGERLSTLFVPGSSDVRFAHWREVLLRACPDFWLARQRPGHLSLCLSRVSAEQS